MKLAVQFTLGAIVLAALAIVAFRFDVRAIAHSLRHLNLLVVAVGAGGVLFAKIGAKVERSQRVLDDVAGAAAPRWRETARLLLASHAAGQLAWAPLGFTVRSIALSTHGLAPRTIARVHLHERLAELAALVAIGAIALAAAPGHAGAMLARAATAAIAVAAVITLACLSPRLRKVASARTLARASLWSFASACADLAILALAARAAGLDVAALGPAPFLLAFLGCNLGCAIPVVPAQLGVQEAAIVLALATGGVPPAAGLAAALAYRAAHVLPLVLVGLPALALTARGRTIAA